jgi:flagellar hook-associated protein 1 FlgK
MGLLNSSLQIGRNAILAYQGALQTIGSNVSSAGSPDYTRLSPQLDPIPGMIVGNGLQPGAGAALTDIRRYIDDALEDRLRLATGATQAVSARQSTLSQVEAFLDDVSGAGVASRLGGFFQASTTSKTYRTWRARPYHCRRRSTGRLAFDLAFAVFEARRGHRRPDQRHR